MAATALADTLDDRTSALLSIIRDRGGQDPIRGITWTDWRSEFQPTPGLNLIVGHAPARGTVCGKHLTGKGEQRWTEICAGEPVVVAGVMPDDGPGWSSKNQCVDCRLAFAALLTQDGCEFLPAE